MQIAAGDPIEIGTLLSISGATKSLGLDSQYGVRLALDYLDGKFDGVPGQIDGHDVMITNPDKVPRNGAGPWLATRMRTLTTR